MPKPIQSHEERIKEFSLEQERLWICGMPVKAFDAWSKANDPDNQARSKKEAR